jgi:nucleoside-diphosphate-sugar epimerase
MKKQLHIVLGGSGAIGQSVILSLKKRNIKTIAVERSKKIKNTETRLVDLLDQEQTALSLADATHVYLCVGLPYNTKIWKREWPILAESVIRACEKSGAKLIFLDNVYMYGPKPLAVPFDETHQQIPSSQKGIVRKEVADMILSAHSEKRIQAVIGRSADFYGPNAVNSALYTSFLERMLRGKAPQSLSKQGIKHTYAFSLDNGDALVRLALDATTYGEVWHLPVGDAVTVDYMLELMNNCLNTAFKVSYLGTATTTILSLFIPIIKEVKEMLYQFDNTYIMSDAKFRQHFPDFSSTPYPEGISVMIDSFMIKNK